LRELRGTKKWEKSAHGTYRFVETDAQKAKKDEKIHSNSKKYKTTFSGRWITCSGLEIKILT